MILRVKKPEQDVGKTKRKTFGKKVVQTYLCRPLKRPVRLRVRTPPFHGGDTSSNLVRATRPLSDSWEAFLFGGKRSLLQFADKQKSRQTR